MLSDIGPLAEDYFRRGYNCAEALSRAVAKKADVKCEFVPNFATPLGAGIGGKGSVCACLTGGALGIGLLYGRADAEDTEKKMVAYEKAKLLYDKFVEKFGATNCKDICGADLSTQEGLERFHKEGLRDNCAKYVKETGDILSEIL
jgi:C_GCAxxG_C_C family probable redox protein